MDDDATVPVRRIRDPKVLRALAHPVRIRILEELAFAGPATATELAELVDESPANCSWHLRQLARYGYVEEAGGGTGRQRPWQVVLQSNRWGDPASDADLTLAGNAAAEVLLAHEVEALNAWRGVERHESPAWRKAAFVTQSMGWLTAAELAEVDEQVKAILMRFLARLTRPEARPEGARPVRFMAWGIPARPPMDEEMP